MQTRRQALIVVDSHGQSRPSSPTRQNPFPPRLFVGTTRGLQTILHLIHLGGLEVGFGVMDGIVHRHEVFQAPFDAFSPRHGTDFVAAADLWKYRVV